MGRLRRYANSENRERIEKIFEMRLKGYVWAEIAEAFNMGVANVQQAYYRECRYRKAAFEYPFIEYIGTHTYNVVRKCLGEKILNTPQQLADLEKVKAVLCWPGVGTKTIQDLSEGLEEAGYEGFDADQAYKQIFQPKSRRRSV
ncbi:MAG: hypothetical protein K9K62_05475 [Desulfobacteraceae bacterium]|nr:hypothetical protein [Desulfobacteraceae bacterium]